MISILAIESSASLRELASDEPDFEMLRGNPRFETLIDTSEHS